MSQSRFLFFIRQSFQGFAWTLLISACFAAVILLTIVSLRAQDEKIRPCSNEDFVYELNLIAPMQLGVDSWQIGDYARYRYRRKQAPNGNQLLFDREVGFHIIDELGKFGTHGYWMRKTGFSPSRGVPMDIYRYVTVHDLRITPKNPKYEFLRNYFPMLLEFCDQAAIPFAKLVKLGKEVVETEAGTFECIHYRAELGPNRNRRVLEVWASPTVPPLGIVRVRSKTEMLDLTWFGQDTEITVPKIFQPVIEGISKLDHGCTSCHGYENCHQFIFPPK